MWRHRIGEYRMTCIFCGQPEHNRIRHCHTCGLPEHRWVDCITALRAALHRKKLMAEQLYEACKVAREWMWNNAYRNISRSPTLEQIELAIEQSEKESNAGS